MRPDADLAEPEVPEGARRPHDWEGRYRSGDTPWDLGGPPPVLLQVLERHPARTRVLRVLVPGAGTGHDAIAWARAGHRVVAIDIAPAAVARARENVRRAGVSVEVLLADLFALPARLAGAFDVVWEQTCFCAIPPERRPEYVDAMASVLRPGGSFHGLFWNHGRPGGPPYDVTVGEVRASFAPRFVEVSVEPVVESVPTRRHEFLAVYRRP